ELRPPRSRDRAGHEDLPVRVPANGREREVRGPVRGPDARQLLARLGSCGRSAPSAHARRILPARGASGASAPAPPPPGGNPSREVDPAHGGADSLPTEADMGKEPKRLDFDRWDVFGVALDAVAIPARARRSRRTRSNPASGAAGSDRPSAARTPNGQG